MRWVTLWYAAALCAWNLARVTPLSRWGPFEIADIAAWVLWLPLPFLVLVAAVRRQWGSLAILALPVVVFGIDYGPQFLPHRDPEGSGLLVATANLHYRNPEPERAIAAVAGIDVDVLAVQELTVDMADALVPSMRRRYPYRVLYPRRDSEGLGVFSKRPLRAMRGPELAVGSCRCHSVVVPHRNGEFLFVNTHLPRPVLGVRRFDASRQVRTVSTLVRTIDDSVRPAVLVGDLNVSDRHYLYRRLRAHLGDAHREAGWGLGLTWSLRGMPFARIDYVLHGEGWRARAVSRVSVPGSDHRALVAELVRPDRD